MTAGRQPDPPPDLSGDWQLDAEPALDQETGDRRRETGKAEAPAGAVAFNPQSAIRNPQSEEVPPSPEQLVEAMLFVGGHPLTADAACAAVRGLTPERFLAAVDSLARSYRHQRRPYTILPRAGGFALVVTPAYRGLRERLFGGPREARLSHPAIDVLSVVAYRQPVGKAEIDALRGTDSGSLLRQLVRLGLVAVRHRAEAGNREVRYGTTTRFLKVFGLGSLDELPRLGDTSQV